MPIYKSNEDDPCTISIVLKQHNILSNDSVVQIEFSTQEFYMQHHKIHGRVHCMINFDAKSIEMIETVNIPTPYFHRLGISLYDDYQHANDPELSGLILCQCQWVDVDEHTIYKGAFVLHRVN